MRCGEANFLWGNGPWQERIGARRQPLVTIVVARDRRVMATPGFWRVSGGYAVLALKASVRHMVPARLRGLVRPTGYPRDRS
jgi:hypothetical protein